MASEINIDNLSDEELVLLQLQIKERIAKLQVNRTQYLKPDTEDYEDNKIRTTSDNRTTYCDDNNIYYDGEDTAASFAELMKYNQFLKKPSIQRMSCPPPPIPKKQVAKIVDTDDQNNIKINPTFTRCSSLDSGIEQTNRVVPTAKPRRKLEVHSTKPPVKPKPLLVKDTSMNALINQSTNLSLYKGFGHTDGCEVTSANRMLTSKLIEEFNRIKLVDTSEGTLRRVRARNNELLTNNTGDFIKKSNNTEELGDKLSRSISTGSLHYPNSSTLYLPPILERREPLKRTSLSNDVINRISTISNKAADNIRQQITPKRNTRIKEVDNIYDEEDCYKYNKNNEPIYESIAESMYEEANKSCTVYEESDVFKNIRRGNMESVHNILPKYRAESQTPPPLPPKHPSLKTKANIPNVRRSDGETESESSSIYSDNTKGSSFSQVYDETQSIYLPSYPPGEESGFYDLDMNPNYKESLDRINQSEKIYIEQLEKICGIYTENIGRADENQMKTLFGEIQGILDFHKKFYRQFRTCHTLPQFGKLVIEMESDFDIYIRDQWCKSTTTISDTPLTPIFMPYRDWTENHLLMYHHLLKQLLDNNDPDIKVAATIISELFRQCEAIRWLKEVTNFPKIQESGKFLLQNKFSIKINYMNRGYCDVIFLEKYILCVSSESKACFCNFNTSKISVAKKGPKTLFIENIFKKKKVTLKSNDPNIIETWYNRYLCLVHKKSG